MALKKERLNTGRSNRSSASSRQETSARSFTSAYDLPQGASGKPPRRQQQSFAGGGGSSSPNASASVRQKIGGAQEHHARMLQLQGVEGASNQKEYNPFCDNQKGVRAAMGSLSISNLNGERKFGSPRSQGTRRDQMFSSRSSRSVVSDCTTDRTWRVSDRGDLTGRSAYATGADAAALASGGGSSLKADRAAYEMAMHEMRNGGGWHKTENQARMQQGKHAPIPMSDTEKKASQNKAKVDAKRARLAHHESRIIATYEAEGARKVEKDQARVAVRSQSQAAAYHRANERNEAAAGPKGQRKDQGAHGNMYHAGNHNALRSEVMEPLRVMQASGSSSDVVREGAHRMVTSRSVRSLFCDF
jgi:hypothetical protein